MKMYHSRFIASFVLAIFLTSISVVLIAWACDSLKDAVDDYRRQVKAQNDRIDDIEAEGYLGSMSEGASWGMGVGFTVGVAETAATGPFAPATAIPLIAKSTLLGGVGGTVWGGIDHHNNLSDARDELERLEGYLAEAESKYERCRKPPPTTFTYTDYNGHVYTFSDEESYNNFLSSRGHSTI